MKPKLEENENGQLRRFVVTNDGGESVCWRLKLQGR